MHSRTIRLALASLLSLAAGRAHADALAPIDRPITLPAGAMEATLRGDYSNWKADDAGDTLSGAALGIGFDYGVTDRFQAGLAAAFPIDPGAGFGSLLASIDYALRPGAALRLDIGVENITSSDNFGDSDSRALFFAGIGAPQKWRLGPMVALTICKPGALNFGHFTNLGADGSATYIGASTFVNNAADFLSVTTSTHSGDGVVVNVNFPIGLEIQPDPHFGFTFHAGYNALFSIPSGGSTEVDHFIPVGLDVVISPNNAVDIGASFTLAGFVASSSDTNLGYTDLRMVELYLKWRI